MTLLLLLSPHGETQTGFDLPQHHLCKLLFSLVALHYYTAYTLILPLQRFMELIYNLVCNTESSSNKQENFEVATY